MFFGLTNSPAMFQTMMNAIFKKELRAGWLTIYMDDMLIHTKNDLLLHQKLVHRVLNKLKHHNLFLKPEKCLFKQQIMEFLGVVLKNRTIRMDPTKVKGVARLATTTNNERCTSFLGIYQILPLLCPKLLNDRKTTH